MLILKLLLVQTRSRIQCFHLTLVIILSKLLQSRIILKFRVHSVVHLCRLSLWRQSFPDFSPAQIDYFRRLFVRWCHGHRCLRHTDASVPEGTFCDQRFSVTTNRRWLPYLEVVPQLVLIRLILIKCQLPIQVCYHRCLLENCFGAELLLCGAFRLHFHV